MNNENKKVYSITTKKKKMIFAKIKNIKGFLFNEDYLISILPQINDLTNIDLTMLLNLKINEYSKCLFLEKHYCWISSNKKGKQRYFTKGFLTYSLDIYDLLTIYFNCTFNKLFKHLLDLGFNDNVWKKDENEKHKENILKIQEIINKNELISNIVKDKIDIYLSLSEFASNNTLSFDKYKNNSMFFISTRYLKEKYNLKYSISTINQVINLYSLLGLIYKIPEKEIKNNVYFDYAKIKTKRAPISFYAIPSLKLYSELERKCSVITENDIQYYNINKYSSKILQENYIGIDSNYNRNPGGGNKTVKAISNKLKKDKIEDIFEEYLKKSTIIAKEWIKNDLNEEISDSSFDKKWKILTSNKTGIRVKPTKKMKLKYGLETNQEIFIIKEN